MRVLLRTVGCLLDVAVLATLRPDWATLAHGVAAPHDWAERVGADRALTSLAGAALWLAAAWLGLGLLAAGCARLPGVGGRAASLLCAVTLPAVLRRVLIGSAGLGIALAPAAALAAPPGPPSPARASIPAATAAAPSWPVRPATTHTLAPPAWPTSSSAATTTPRGRPEVTVQPGDSLWLIAQRRLGRSASAARTATAWPRWYAANRAVIGDDPDLVLPGQRLRAPASAAPRLPTTQERSS